MHLAAMRCAPPQQGSSQAAVKNCMKFARLRDSAFLCATRGYCMSHMYTCSLCIGPADHMSYKPKPSSGASMLIFLLRVLRGIVHGSWQKEKYTCLSIFQHISRSSSCLRYAARTARISNFRKPFACGRPGKGGVQNCSHSGPTPPRVNTP
jgi:hypothetical protein